MKKYVIAILLIGFVNFVFGQTERISNKNVADSFEANYNSDNFEEIFLSFSPEMQNALPLDKTKEFLIGLKTQVGKITKRQFVKYEQTYASYKTNFERALFAVNISVDNNDKINGLFVKPFKESNLPKIVRNSSKLILPFKDQWTVIWGGDTKDLNYHVESEAQKNAFDFVITDSIGKSYKTDGKTNEDYYAFGKELFAPCDGEIVLVVDGVKDNVPGVLNPVYVPGNTVIIKTENNEFLFFAHFKHHSIIVKEGQKIKQGQLLGLCGNSGNSSEAHLHFHIQNVEDMNTATGVKCYFDKIQVDGQTKMDYSPIQHERISN
ncbi:M23 family metallopeptidase [Flectobacillus roseus]|uniref:Peptidoglycan DD-metalloendopeptidase family protein n=1 Tax=Flectobacillus roseus TaxID=502259 RepID=A0ABT6YFA8_9BACT|nr:M23 family metallopeptidase [Flectobacillus roseus]MDI9862277.1 peptidoglycan DD-metalloendopeptidase family protein [Flectobacillus roseus]